MNGWWKNAPHLYTNHQFIDQLGVFDLADGVQTLRRQMEHNHCERRVMSGE